MNMMCLTLGTLEVISVILRSFSSGISGIPSRQRLRYCMTQPDDAIWLQYGHRVLPPPSGGRRGGGTVQGLPNALQYAWEILQHFMIPKPQHPYTVRLEVARALRIAGALWRGVVLASIELNRQSHCGAIEIQHEACDGVLLAKAKTVELFATEALPQALLCVGQVLAQVSCGLQEGRWDGGGSPGVLFPPPNLPPLGGGVRDRVF